MGRIRHKLLKAQASQTMRSGNQAAKAITALAQDVADGFDVEIVQMTDRSIMDFFKNGKKGDVFPLGFRAKIEEEDDA
jgi:hypothetical protein